MFDKPPTQPPQQSEEPPKQPPETAQPPSTLHPSPPEDFWPKEESLWILGEIQKEDKTR